MLQRSMAGQMRAAFDNTIDMLGVPATWAPADKSDNRKMTVGFRVVGKEDALIVNSYGIETRVITVSTSLTDIVPVKFDTFTIGTLTLVVHAVHTVFINADLVGYKCYALGA
jgi:hypothetical protein